MSYKTLKKATFAVVFGLALVLFIPLSVYALKLQVPFGGTILTVVDCSCTSFSLSLFKKKAGVVTQWITIGPPVAGSFLRTPLTSVHKKGNISSKNKAIGTALPVPTPCLVGKIPLCVPVGFGFPIVTIGTD